MIHWWLALSDRLDLDFGHNEINHGTSDDYYTPPFIFEALGLRYDIDVCSPPEGSPWIPADRFLSIIDDGLETPWEGRVWMNPPYSKPTPWIHKWLNHGNGIGLVPMSKAAWFNVLWEREDVAFISLINTLRFMTPNGESKGIFMPTVLIGIGAENIQAMRSSGLGRVR
jgi:hypothetical protein